MAAFPKHNLFCLQSFRFRKTLLSQSRVHEINLQKRCVKRKYPIIREEEANLPGRLL